MKNMILIMIIILPFILGCQVKNEVIISVKNDLNFIRIQETVEIKYADLAELFQSIDINVFDKQTNETLITQKIDENGDSKPDLLIFQSDFNANEQRLFLIKPGSVQENEVKSKVYARFVPERKDDFAWENDRIAFRMYGPALQNTPGEISGSGIDVWAKSVDYLIIDKWYKAEDYHTDYGEGCDYYKVGPSRGSGGIGIWENGELKVSKNFISWKILANGPIRTAFQLIYAPWSLNKNSVSEVKTISIDAGSFMNKIESSFEFVQSQKVQYAVGIVKREGLGKSLSKENFVSYWEPADKKNGSTGTGIIIDSSQMAELKEIEDHYLAIGNLSENEKALYYAGAGWEKNEHLSGSEDWEAYVEKYVLCLNSPLKIELLK